MKIVNPLMTGVAGMVIAISFFCFTESCSVNTKPGGYYHEFNLSQVADSNPHVARIADGEGFEGKVLKVSPADENRSITLWEKGDEGSWENADYLVVEVWHKNNHCGYTMWSFYGTAGNTEEITFQGDDERVRKITEGPRITTKIGVLPKLKTRVIYPLHYLNGQSVFGQRFPRQLKTGTNGKRLEPANITKVVLRFDPYMQPRFTPEFEIAAIYLTDSIPEPFEKLSEPYVDEFGQWALKEWPGKTHSLEEMKAMNDSLLKSVPTTFSTNELSRYGGWKKMNFGATGFFRTHHDGKRWWLVDPDGYAFLSVGVDGVRSAVEGPVNGQEDLYKWLPAQLSEQPDPARRGRRMVDFYGENLRKVYGDDWRKNWEKITSGLLRQYNFNTVGNWSDIDLALNNKLPYVFPMNGFPSTDTLLYRDFPDVFSPKYAERSEIFAQQMERFKGDPLMIGYFLRNEPTWAFGFNNIAFEMFAVNTPSHTKNEFVKWISEKYNNDPAAFSKAWGTDLKSFDELGGRIFRSIPGKTAEDDFLAFSGIMVKKYVDVPCDAIEKIDPVHLNLGLRYGSVSSDLLYNASDRFDVFSINSYGRDPAETKTIAEKSGKPVMIGEFHFGALDRGLPATGLGAALNQADRGKAYQHYIETGFARPELVAIHWFIWIDQLVTGRSDGENYNIGLVDICNRPYPEVTAAAKISNGRVYDVATGKVKPAPDDYERVPLVR